MKSKPSLVLGFCKCKNCGFEKYYWNTYFVCAECGAKGEKSYERTGYREILRKEEERSKYTNEDSDDRDDHCNYD